MNTFVHLHTHSYYSLLDGVPSPEELVIAAKKAGFKALALTDHNALYGAVTFYQVARDYGLKPIIGAELTMNDGFPLLFLVQNETGYRNLCQLISIGRLRGGHGKFKLTYNDLKPLTEGLIVLSGGHKGKIYHLLRKRQIDQALLEVQRLKNLFAKNFYLEMQHFSNQDLLVNLRLRDIAAETKTELVATNDVHFNSANDWYLRRILHAIDANGTLEQVTTAGTSQQYLKSAKEMQALFKAFPTALANTQKIARQCAFEFQLGKPIFPSVEIPQGESSFSYLWKQCFAGANERYQPLTPQVIKRLEFELETIHQLGFAEYFLIVKDIVDFCRREHIPCVGRGSAADSLVAYVLGITQVDPIRHNLYFERFLNPQRSDPPDIDLDICWKNRDRVLKYVYDRFGHKRTAMICTFNTFQNRSALRDVAKAYGLPEDEIAKITKYLPHRHIDQIEEAVNTLPELKELRYNLTMYEEIMRIARRIADFPRHLSIHPGGVIIAPDQITRHVPLEVAGKEIVIAQYDMYSIEKLGLVKMDLLGVRSLSIITDCLKSIKERHGNDLQQLKAQLLLKKSAELSPLDLRTIPEDDPEVTAFIRSGRTMGCFQLESPAMRGLLRKMQIESVDDVITAVALIRPGASGSGMKEVYIKRRAGLEKTAYVHPSLEEPLKETYGVIIYQEQVLRVAHAVAGLSLGQADILRRAMTKSRTKKEFLAMRSSFIQGALNKGLNQKQAETVWRFLAQFVGYGFNKAHSATYGTIAYQTAFLKYYFPAEYMCAVLNNQGGFYRRAAYVEEVRRLGIPLLPPDVTQSQAEFTCEGDGIRVGLSTVFELSAHTVKRIIEERQKAPFKDLFDFLRRTRAGEKETRHLIKVGALNALLPNEPKLLLMNEIYFKNKKHVSLSAFLSEDVGLAPYNRFQKIVNELELLDFAVTDHPLALCEDQIARIKPVSSLELERHKNKCVTFVGWLVTMRRVQTKNKTMMKFITLEDREGLVEAVLFEKAYKKYGHLFKGYGPYVVKGRVQSRLPGEANLLVEEVEALPLEKKKLETNSNSSIKYEQIMFPYFQN
ncbi:DNA polymerase III subunit alpha [Caldithrix abyssi]|nr:DNA polymerase III subunit alpha [Caldithrix abyssi]